MQLWDRVELLRERADMSEGSFEIDVYATLYQPFILRSEPPMVTAW